MSILDAGKACIASELSVTVTHNGKPVRGAKITRQVEWDNVGEKSDSTTTSASGEFKLPALYMRSLVRSILPLEFVASTLVQIDIDGEYTEILYAVKRSEEPGVEFGGKTVLKCELSRDESTHRFGASLLSTRCEIIE
ncbi:DUF6795 domain-containing protein [Endozoicomonas lisbonensis]|uniref:DUF6795 domain-containing protein n=1 Tax=Endozoicomonas lisbonensis TaxID=3120522 RepID=A0ABV2SAS4_9GAMM